jgi:hypothetical protein
MNIHLSTEQLQAAPVRVTDPDTNREYVVLRAEVFDRLRQLADDDVRSMQPLLANLQPEDWEDASNYDVKP